MQFESNFEWLPPELLLPILTHLPDLESLDNLLKASPAAFRLFDIHGAKIFEAVLSSDVAHEYTCALIRIVALIRSSSLPPEVHDLISFQNLVRHESTSHRYKPPLWTSPPSKSSSDVPATVLRGLLATYRKIACLTISCLKFYLNRFKPLRPSHLVDETFHFENQNYGEDHYVPSWQQKPAEKPFPVQDTGTATWIEEQRVLRAFWRVQLFQDLKTASNGSLDSWPESDVRRLNNMTVVGLHDVPIVRLLGQAEFVDAEPFVYQQDTLLEDELIWSVVDYAKDDRETIIAPNFLQTRRDWPTPTAKGPRDLETITYHTPMTFWFFHLVSDAAAGFDSPIQHISFEPFRRLGFAIWDEERMFGYGLLNPERCRGNDSCLLAWRSVLGRDDIAEVEIINQERYKWAMKSDSDDEGE